jgi:hypothetical protein
MYKRPYPLDEPLLDTVRVITETVKALCCTGALRIGDRCKVLQRTSENRVVVKGEVSGIHKVKRSTFIRCTTEAPKILNT